MSTLLMETTITLDAYRSHSNHTSALSCLNWLPCFTSIDVGISCDSLPPPHPLQTPAFLLFLRKKINAQSDDVNVFR